MRMVLRYAVVLLMGLTLSGCVSSTWNSMFGDTAPVVKENSRKESLRPSEDDPAIVTEVSDALRSHSPQEAEKVSVFAYRNQVFVVGEGSDEFEAYAFMAAKNADDAEGAAVYMLRPSDKNTNSELLEQQVVYSLQQEPTLKEYDIAVKVVQNDVVLLGIIDNYGVGSSAVKQAKKVNGVGVVKTFFVFSK